MFAAFGGFLYYAPPAVPSGKLFSWGSNTNGQLGDNTATYRSSPVQIGAGTTWLVLGSAQYNGSAIQSNNTLWTWGQASNGALGNNTRLTNISSPIQIGGLSNWATISGNPLALHFAAIKTDGTLWTWGLNQQGELGQGNIVYRSSPIQIAGTSWLQPYTGYRVSSSIKTDGTLWTWGYNNNGQLGDGTKINKSSPVQVGLLTNWQSMTHGLGWVAAIKTDGTLWVWGSGVNGTMGDSTNISKSSPTQIGSGTSWRQVAISVYTGLGIKNDGSLWLWGNASTSIITVNTSSPVQIGTGISWSSMSTWANATSLKGAIQAISNSGKLYAWGTSTVGQFGTNQSGALTSQTPTQVGLLTTWSQIQGGGNSFYARI